MSRTIGGQTTWGSNGETWADTNPANPSGTTWADAAPLTDLQSRILDDPDTGQGQLVNTVSSGTIRFVVQVLNPTLATDSVWGTAAWGTGHWSSSVGAWEDLSCRVRLADWVSGVNGPLTKSQVGTATIVLENLDGLVSPLARSGHYTNGASSWLRTGALVRIGALVTGALTGGLPVTVPALGTFTPFFTGKIESSLDGLTEGVDAFVTLKLTETTALVGGVNPTDQQCNADRSLTSTIFEAMSASGWPFQTSLVVPNEDASVPSYPLSGGSSASRLDLLTDGMHWDYAADGRGRLFVTRRHFADADSGIVFANKPTGTQVPIEADGITPYSNVERLANDLTAATVATLNPIAREDARAVTKFGPITTAYGFPRNDLVLETDAQVTALLLRVLSLRAWDDLGIDTVQVDLDQDAVNLPYILTWLAGHARFGHGVTVAYSHPSGFTFTEYGIVEAQHHTVTPVGQPGSQLKWTATLSIGHAGTVGES